MYDPLKFCTVRFRVGRTKTIVDLTSFVNQFTSSVSYQILMLLLVFLECSIIPAHSEVPADVPITPDQVYFCVMISSFPWGFLSFFPPLMIYHPNIHNLQRNCKIHSHENLKSLKAKTKKQGKRRINPPWSSLVSHWMTWVNSFVTAIVKSLKSRTAIRLCHGQEYCLFDWFLL